MDSSSKAVPTGCGTVKVMPSGKSILTIVSCWESGDQTAIVDVQGQSKGESE